MNTYLHISPSGEIIAIHKSNHTNSKVMVPGHEVIEVKLDKSLEALSFEQLKTKYMWHRGRKELTRK